MARSGSLIQERIGSKVTGYYNGVKYIWYLSLAKEPEAKTAAARIGLTDIKIYPIYKDTPPDQT